LPSGLHKGDYEAPLEAAGMRLVDTVTRELNLLVLADPNSTSSKAAKARKLGIEVISEEALRLKLGPHAPASAA
jgi:DNA ligase (NAD+)